MPERGGLRLNERLIHIRYLILIAAPNGSCRRTIQYANTRGIDIYDAISTYETHIGISSQVISYTLVFEPSEVFAQLTIRVLESLTFLRVPHYVRVVLKRIQRAIQITNKTLPTNNLTGYIHIQP